MKIERVRSSFLARGIRFYESLFSHIPTVEFLSLAEIDGNRIVFPTGVLPRKGEKDKNPGSYEDSEDENEFFHKHS